jgi:NAD(P)-dependent dehydrogenase (short-subunit alcohol dehydrogenase family)
VSGLGGLDILVNNAAYQLEQPDIADITEEQYERTLATNLTAPFFVTKYALPYLQKTKGNVINTVSVDAYVGPRSHLDYSVTKGGLVTFTRSLANQQAEHGVRVNGVAPGPI